MDHHARRGLAPHGLENVDRPSTLVRRSRRFRDEEPPTSDCAARWNSTSGRDSFTAPCSAARSRMSRGGGGCRRCRGARPRTGSAAYRAPAQSPCTWAPSEFSQSASQPPLKPVWPVMRTRLPRQNSSLTAKFPRRPSAGPHFLQLVAIAQRVHRLPEAPMKIGRQRPLLRQALERFVFPDVASPST